MSLSEFGSYVTEFFGHIMRLLSVRIPVFNLTVFQFLIGSLVITLSLRVIGDLLSVARYASSHSRRYRRKGKNNEGSD